MTLQSAPLDIPRGDFSAYLFDCDGTLADTMPAHYRAWTEALGAHAGIFPEALFYEFGGMPTARIVEVLNERNGLRLPVEETVARKEAIFLKRIPEVTPIEPVVELARQYSRDGKPMAVVSGGHRAVVMKTLRALGLDALFTVYVTSEDYARGKPAPDPFLKAAELLGVPPAECLVFEDSATGLASAQAAGMLAVFVPAPARQTSAALTGRA